MERGMKRWMGDGLREVWRWMDVGMNRLGMAGCVDNEMDG